MLLQALLSCLLANVLLIECADIVIVDVFRPRASSLEAHNEQIRNFWTSDRLKAAIPLDLQLPNLSSRSTSINSSVLIGSPSSVEGSLPSSNDTKSRSISPNGRHVTATGRVFWSVGSSGYSCSASVINSNSKDLVSTAGHCVYDTNSRRWFNNNNWIFIPAYSNNQRPHGTWPARRFLSSQAWTNSADFNYDVAFVALSSLNGRHVQDAVGSQGIGFNQARLAYTYSFGYPGNLDNGQYLKSCVGYAQRTRYTQNGFVGQGLSCNMGGGSSGGPWLQNVVESTGIGYVTSVNSFGVSNLPNTMFGPYFDSNTQSLYDQAKTM